MTNIRTLMSLTALNNAFVAYGPTPSGVAATDTAALQAASDAIAARATGAVTVGGTLQLKAGTYYLNATWFFNQQAITVKGVGPSTIIKWAGAASTNMIDIRDSTRVTFSDMTILGDATNPPAAGIYFNAPTLPVVGTNEYLKVQRVMFGRRYTIDGAGYAPMQYGIRIGGAVIGNNDTLSVEDCVIQDASVIGLYIQNEQNRWNTLKNVIFNGCATSLRVQGNTTAHGLSFNRSSVVDMYIAKGTLDLFGYNSEHAAMLWDQQTGSSLSVRGGHCNLQAEIGSNWASSAVSNYNHLVLDAFWAEDQLAANPKLFLTGSSSNTNPAYVSIRGCTLPNGASDTGYTINGYGSGTPLSVDIQQGAYWRHQVVQSLNAASTWTPPIPAPQVDDYTASGTWTKPTGAVRVRTICVGAGGGGGSGRRGAAGAIRCGGGGGGGGTVAVADFMASQLGSTETITVGAAGPGGAAVTVDSTDGNTGTAGGGTSFGSTTNRWLVAFGGAAGSGGTATAGTAGASAAPGGSAGTGASTTGAAGSTANVGTSRGSASTAGGGASGGGLTTGNVESAGGTGSLAASGTNTAPVAGTATGGAGSAGGDARLPAVGGGGGAGGGSATGGTTPGGAGGNGGLYGGGGGGGGASANGANSGKGGDGTGGFVRVITYFE